MDFYTSDLHVDHVNVILYDNRPFSSLEVMRAELIKNWNTKVKKTDRVFILGDMVIKRKAFQTVLDFLDQCNGTKLIIPGNHDKGWLNQDEYTVIQHSDYLEDNHDIHILPPIYEYAFHDHDTNKHQYIVMCHYPLLSWNHMHHNSWALHGHTHGSINHLNDQHTKRLDVWVGNNNWAPFSYTEVKAIMTQKTFRPVDHHGD